MEWVWGLPRAALFGQVVPEFQGFVSVSGTTPGSSGDPAISDLGDALGELGSFRPRTDAEDDPTWKQIIPYVVVRCGDRTLMTERLATQGESRLHHKLSIGIGGHVNREGDDPSQLLAQGLARELREELVWPTELAIAPTLIGFVNDDSNAVGQVHFGVACRIEVEQAVAIRECDAMCGQYVDDDALVAAVDRLESWSRFLLPALCP